MLEKKLFIQNSLRLLWIFGIIMAAGPLQACSPPQAPTTISLETQPALSIQDQALAYYESKKVTFEHVTIQTPKRKIEVFVPYGYQLNQQALKELYQYYENTPEQIVNVALPLDNISYPALVTQRNLGNGTVIFAPYALEYWPEVNNPAQNPDAVTWPIPNDFLTVVRVPYEGHPSVTQAMTTEACQSTLQLSATTDVFDVTNPTNSTGIASHIAQEARCNSDNVALTARLQGIDHLGYVTGFAQNGFTIQAGGRIYDVSQIPMDQNSYQTIPTTPILLPK